MKKEIENLVLALVFCTIVAYFTYKMTKSGMIDDAIRYIKNPSKY